MTILISLVIGIIIGLATAYVLRVIHAKTAKELADELFQESETRKSENLNSVIDTVMKLAKQKLETERELNVKELDSKKGLIDQQLVLMTTELEKVSKMVNEFEKDRENKFGELTKQMELTSKQTGELIQTTGNLREALASSKVRGQWGERMAEDVLRVAGFIENVNYLKQTAIKGERNIPDFTFLLPRDLKLNMDVKFPFDNYMKFLEADTESEKENYRKNFLRDVKNRINEITTRDYINPEQNTVDYVLLFIPNEQIYSFINEQDNTILDEGIKKRVIVCSPITLFAVLAVIRQAVENFALEKTSNEILSLFGSFKKQWLKFRDGMDKLGKRIEDSQKEFNTLYTTRSNQLEKPLNKIEEIRTFRGIPIDDNNPPEIEE
ncbi:MAG TPA: DNA recombination protein RmuC [bacterium]|nr:DNA recombination protein RmuC [bacterium]